MSYLEAANHFSIVNYLTYVIFKGFSSGVRATALRIFIA